MRLIAAMRPAAYSARDLGRAFFIIAGAAVSAVALPVLARETDGQIKQRIVEESIASYPGSCPCPYNADRSGRKCGGRSAYNRAGGYAPICYASDVSVADIAAYRARH